MHTRLVMYIAHIKELGSTRTRLTEIDNTDATLQYL